MFESIKYLSGLFVNGIFDATNLVILRDSEAYDV